MPSRRETQEQILKFHIEFLQHGRGDKWEQVMDLLDEAIKPRMDRWLRFHKLRLTIRQEEKNVKT